MTEKIEESIGEDFDPENSPEMEARELRKLTTGLVDDSSDFDGMKKGLSSKEEEDDFFDEEPEEEEVELSEDDLLSKTPLEEFSRIKEMFADFDEGYLDETLVSLRNYYFGRLYQINVLLMRYDNLLDLYQPPLDGRIRLVERFNNESGKQRGRNTVRHPVVWKYKETQRKWYPTWLPVERLTRRVSQKPEFGKNYFHLTDMLRDIQILLRLHGRIAKRLAEVTRTIRNMDSWMKEMDEVIFSYKVFVAYAKHEKMEELREANRKRLLERKKRLEENDGQYKTRRPKKKFINRTRQNAKALAKARAKAGQGK